MKELDWITNLKKTANQFTSVYSFEGHPVTQVAKFNDFLFQEGL